MVGQGFMGPDSLLVCRVSAPNISGGLSLPNLPVSCMSDLCTMYPCPGHPEDLPPSLAEVVEDACGDDEAWQVLLHLAMHAESLSVCLSG